MWESNSLPKTFWLFTSLLSIQSREWNRRNWQSNCKLHLNLKKTLCSLWQVICYQRHFHFSQHCFSYKVCSFWNLHSEAELDLSKIEEVFLDHAVENYSKLVWLKIYRRLLQSVRKHLYSGAVRTPKLTFGATWQFIHLTITTVVPKDSFQIKKH